MFAYEDDDRSLITPNIWALFGRVWNHNDWPRHSMMNTCKGADGDASIISAKEVPLGYQLHLCAVQSYLKSIMEQSREYSEKVAKICWERQPNNMFYGLLHIGNRNMTTYEYTQSMKFWIDFFLEHCPSKDFEPTDHWLFESSDIMKSIEEGKGTGWDWVFVGRLLLRKLGEL